MLTAEQLRELKKRADQHDHRAALYLADRDEIRQELERIRDFQLAGADPMTFGRLTALIERMK